MSLLDALIEDSLREPPAPVTLTGAIRREIRVNIRTDYVIGSGTPDDPYNGGIDNLLDDLLNDATRVPADASIRFGPGIFQTKGNGGFLTGFAPLSGQRFIGSGMYQTTLQLVKAAPDPVSGSASIGIFSTGANVHDIEISDMTLDCNLSRQPLDNGKPAPIEVKAVGFSNCSRVRLRRVRIINWGTHTPATEDSSHESFPIFAVSESGGAKGEAIIEDCVIEQPDLSPARESTLILNRAEVGSPEILATVRNNYLNCDATTGAPPPAVEVVSIEYIDSGTNLKVRTKWPHRLQQRDYVLFAGSPVSAFNDRFQLELAQYPDSDPNAFLTFKLAKPPTISGTPDLNGANVTVQRYVPRAMRVVSLTHSGTTATLKAAGPHLRKADDYIRVSGARRSESDPWRPRRGERRDWRVTGPWWKQNSTG